jgi:Flagellar hook-length control protein FliK
MVVVKMVMQNRPLFLKNQPSQTVPPSGSFSKLLKTESSNEEVPAAQEIDMISLFDLLFHPQLDEMMKELGNHNENVEMLRNVISNFLEQWSLRNDSMTESEEFVSFLTLLPEDWKNGLVQFFTTLEQEGPFQQEDLLTIESILATLLIAANSHSLNLNKEQFLILKTKLASFMKEYVESNPNETLSLQQLNNWLANLKDKIMKLDQMSNGKEIISDIFKKYFSNEMNASLSPNTNQQIKKDVLYYTINHSFHLPAINKVQQFILHVEQNGQPVSKNDFVKQFEFILSRSVFIKGNGQQKLFIKLYPEHLGTLRIELIQQENMMAAKILATTAEAKEMLENHLSHLKHSLAQQNIQIEKIEISHQIQDDVKPSFTKEKENFQDRGHKEHQSHKSEKENHDFQAVLAEELNTQV